MTILANSFSVFLSICCCSVTQSSPILCNPMDYSTPGCPVLHHLLKFAQTHVHWVLDAIQPSHPLLPPSLALNLSKHQSLFQWLSSLHSKYSKMQDSRSIELPPENTYLKACSASFPRAQIPHLHPELLSRCVKGQQLLWLMNKSL